MTIMDDDQRVQKLRKYAKSVGMNRLQAYHLVSTGLFACLVHLEMKVQHGCVDANMRQAAVCW